MPNLYKKLSHLTSIPLLKRIAPAANQIPEAEKLNGFLQCQRLAQKAVVEVAHLIKDGWTEIDAARMISTYLQDCGVKAFFHHPFVWFGDRTRFEGVKNYAQYSPSERILLPGEIFIFDVAPIYNGFTADIGYTNCLTENSDLNKAKKLLTDLRTEIPKLFSNHSTGSSVWKKIDTEIRAAHYDNIHEKYPFSVLGHRVHEAPEFVADVGVLNFGWPSYWQLLSRGLFGQLLNSHFEGDITGLWAVEPHIGGKDFGAKFEEILVVKDSGVEWLEKTPQYEGRFV